MAATKNPHKRLERDMLSNNIAGLANVYCFNHIEGAHVPDKERLTQSEVDTLMAYLNEREGNTAQFLEYIVNFRALNELTYLVGLAIREYELSLHKLVAVDAWRLQNTPTIEVSVYFEDMCKEEDALARATVTRYQRQFVGIMDGVRRLCTPKNKIKHFLPRNWEDVFTAYTEGRDAVLERVVGYYDLSTWTREVAKEALHRVSTLKDVEVAPGFVATLIKKFSQYAEMWHNKRVEEIIYSK